RLHEEKASVDLPTGVCYPLPWGSQLAIASRDEPRMPVGRLRANRNVVELRYADLVMTPSESDALLTATGLALRRDELDTVVRRTEGWTAGLYLAALSLRASASP